MDQIDKNKPVMVTGATGYVAGWVVKRLLGDGMTVHATVRDPGNGEKLKELNAAADQSPGKIVYFKSDLLEKESFKDAMQGCGVVFHTASPFIMDVADPQKDLIEPALAGTRNVLGQVNETASVQRVVLTSSCAAIYGDNCDLEKTASGLFTEEDWNLTSTPVHQPYAYSKTIAEKEAWKINKAQDRWNLVVVNPSLVIGPGISPVTTSESFRIIKQFGDGTMKNGVPDWGIGVVDVRDLAEAHVKAAFATSANGRHIISAHNTSFMGMARPLIDRFGSAYPFPKMVLPKVMVWLIGPFLNPSITRKMIRRNVNYPWRADNSRSIRELGMSYRPLEESMVAFFQQLIDHHIVSPKK
ncbi:MAG: NAD-dependent epimerase/dehydratase family protein [Desulfobacteraceae bacterium]|nr:NAD-dependent epimerase/dehydratase family protein [Desulfobacteraceae bacterium]